MSYTVKDVLHENPNGKTRRVSIKEKSSTSEYMQQTCDGCGGWFFYSPHLYELKKCRGNEMLCTACRP